MKILIDLRLLSKGRFSGIESYTRSLVDRLLLVDKRNEYLFFYNGFRKALLPPAWLKNERVKVINWSVPNRLLDFSLRWFDWPKIDSFFGPDVVYSPHLNLLRVRPSTKRIITFHDLSFIHFPEFFLPRKRFWHWSQDYGRQAKEATLVVTDSAFTKSDLVQTLGLRPEKIKVVYPGIDEFYSNNPPDRNGLSDFARHHGLNCRFLLFVGALEPRKNIPALVSAFNLLKKDRVNSDLKLAIVGEKGWLCDRIFKAIKASPYKNQIVLRQKASSDDLSKLYNLASVFVYPSFFEGFGFPPLEAQSCGLPVVASNRSSLPEILEDSALLVDPWRIDELTLAIQGVLSDVGFRERLKEKGLKNAKRFSWQKTAEVILKIFEEISEHA